MPEVRSPDDMPQRAPQAARQRAADVLSVSREACDILLHELGYETIRMMDNMIQILKFVTPT